MGFKEFVGWALVGALLAIGLLLALYSVLQTFEKVIISNVA